MFFAHPAIYKYLTDLWATTRIDIAPQEKLPEQEVKINLSEAEPESEP